MAVGSNILIVDDNPKNLTEILPMYGYDVDVAYDGQEAVNKLILGNTKYDLVILNDYKNSGWNTLKTIRNNSRFSTIPIMLLISQDEENRQVTGLRIGADDCLSVPYAVPNLLARIEALLRRSAWQNQIVQTPSIQSRSTSFIVGKSKLTQRELEIMKMVAEGNSNSKIAEELVLKEVTVKTHLNNIFKKFKVQNRMQAVLTAKKLNLIK